MRQVLIAGADLGTAGAAARPGRPGGRRGLLRGDRVPHDPPRGRVTRGRRACGRRAARPHRAAAGVERHARAGSWSAARFSFGELGLRGRDHPRRGGAGGRRPRPGPPLLRDQAAPLPGGDGDPGRLLGGDPTGPRRPPGRAGRAHCAVLSGAVGLAGDAPAHARDRPLGRDGPGGGRHAPPGPRGGSIPGPGAGDGSPRRGPACDARGHPAGWPRDGPLHREGRSDRVSRPRGPGARDRAHAAALPHRGRRRRSIREPDETSPAMRPGSWSNAGSGAGPGLAAGTAQLSVLSASAATSGAASATTGAAASTSRTRGGATLKTISSGSVSRVTPAGIGRSRARMIASKSTSHGEINLEHLRQVVGPGPDLHAAAGVEQRAAVLRDGLGLAGAVDRDVDGQLLRHPDGEQVDVDRLAVDLVDLDARGRGPASPWHRRSRGR